MQRLDHYFVSFELVYFTGCEVPFGIMLACIRGLGRCDRVPAAAEWWHSPLNVFGLGWLHLIIYST